MTVAVLVMLMLTIGRMIVSMLKVRIRLVVLISLIMAILACISFGH